MNALKRSSLFYMLSTGFATACLLAISAPSYGAPVLNCPDLGVSQTQIDLTTDGSSTTINNAIFTAFDSSGSVGTGVFPAFVREQGNGCIQGYNTQGVEQFDTVNNSSDDVVLSNMMVVSLGGVDYVEFRLDLNQIKSNSGPSGPSLDNVQLFVSQNDSLTNWTNCSLGSGSGAVSCVYNMDAGANRALLLDYGLNNGSGNGFDLSMLVPVSTFGAAALADPSKYYVYLYSSFGAVGGAFAENDGFEEWQYRMCSPTTTCVTPQQPDPNPAPEPASLALVAIGLAMFQVVRRKRAA